MITYCYTLSLHDALPIFRLIKPTFDVPFGTEWYRYDNGLFLFYKRELLSKRMGKRLLKHIAYMINDTVHPSKEHLLHTPLITKNRLIIFKGIITWRISSPPFNIKA